jgi:hypothetical protein
VVTQVLMRPAEQGSGLVELTVTGRLKVLVLYTTVKPHLSFKGVFACSENSCTCCSRCCR